MSSIIRRVVFLLILRPLTIRNYRLRAKGKRPDEWYWADVKAMQWGFFCT